MNKGERMKHDRRREWEMKRKGKGGRGEGREEGANACLTEYLFFIHSCMSYIVDGIKISSTFQQKLQCLNLAEKKINQTSPFSFTTSHT